MRSAASVAILGGLMALGAAWVTARIILQALEALDAGLAHDIPGDDWED